MLQHLAGLDGCLNRSSQRQWLSSFWWTSVSVLGDRLLSFGRTPYNFPIIIRVGTVDKGAQLGMGLDLPNKPRVNVHETSRSLAYLNKVVAVWLVDQSICLTKNDSGLRMGICHFGFAATSVFEWAPNGSSPGSSYVDFGHLDSVLRFARHSKANVTEQRTGKVESWFRIVSGGKWW